MLNYNFDDDGFFTGQSSARLDPLASIQAGYSVYLLPRNATHTPTPADVLADNQRWQYLAGQWHIYTEPVTEQEAPAEPETSEDEAGTV